MWWWSWCREVAHNMVAVRVTGVVGCPGMALLVVAEP